MNEVNDLKHNQIIVSLFFSFFISPFFSFVVE